MIFDRSKPWTPDSSRQPCPAHARRSSISRLPRRVDGTNAAGPSPQARWWCSAARRSRRPIPPATISSTDLLSTGLRASEVVSSRSATFYSGRRPCGSSKAKAAGSLLRDALAPLLERFARVVAGRPGGQDVDGGLVVRAQPGRSLSPRQLNRAVQPPPWRQASTSGCRCARTLRHASRPPARAEVDIRIIQAARPQETRHHGDLHAGPPGPAARGSRQSAGDAAAGVGAHRGPFPHRRRGHLPRLRAGVASPSTVT